MKYFNKYIYINNKNNNYIMTKRQLYNGQRERRKKNYEIYIKKKEKRKILEYAAIKNENLQVMRKIINKKMFF